MAHKKHFVLVGTDAVLLYEESQREFGRDTQKEVANLIKFYKADIFVYPEDGLDEDVAFDQFIEQINGWGQITSVTKEYVDEINKLL